MLKRFATLALIGLLTAAAPAQQPGPTTPPAPAQPAAAVRVTLQTTEGPIMLELDKAHAPVTTANFLRYVDQKRLDGTSFYRAMKLGDAGLVQAGPRNDPKRILPPIAHEPTTVTGIKHLDGTISMARHAPGSANADFFITLGAIPSLDADPTAPGDNQGFAAFGRVVEGMDVVRRILDAPTSLTEGEGVMKGQMIAAPIKIISARRVAQ